jgi:predicted Fe-Mo cluster-binding NifX family protein
VRFNFAEDLMDMMRIAVTSQNFRTITGHAGKSRRFIIYELSPNTIREVERLDLPKMLSLHDYHGDDHPLYQLHLNAVVTASAGPGFMSRMQEHGIQVITTAETNIEQVVAALQHGQPLPPGLPHDHDHDHDHSHDHDHEQNHGAHRQQGEMRRHRHQNQRVQLHHAVSLEQSQRVQPPANEEPN